MNNTMNKITGLSMVLMTCGLLLMSCDTSLPANSNEDHGMVIRLELPKSLDVTTKGGSLDGITINNVWVLQYANNTNELLKASKFSGTEISNKVNAGTLEVQTDGFSEAESNFYVIANAGDDFLAKADTLREGATAKPIAEDSLKKKTIALANYTSEPTFVTAGKILLTQDSIRKYNGKAVIVAPLERAFARMKLKWSKKDNFKGSLKITKVDVYNLPKKMAAYTRGGGKLSDKYPKLKEDIKTDATSITTGELSEGSEQVFYMPENLRGMGTVTSFPEKNMPAKGPDGNLDGCTFILMSGYYKYPLESGYSKDSITVQYKIFPGGNLTNDYNIQRGYSYDLKVNISGANSADVRVTITDGRVAVFDDVVVMDPVKVDF